MNKLTILISFLISTTLTHTAFAQTEAQDKDCSVKIANYGYGPSKQLSKFATRILKSKGYTVVDEHDNASFTLVMNALQICTDGRETFWDELFRSFDVANVYFNSVARKHIFKGEMDVQGFAFKALIQKSIYTRRMIKDLPTCKDGVISAVSEKYKPSNY